MLDISSSVDDPIFEAMKNFIKALIDSFNIGDQSVQISVVTFDDDSQVVFDLNAYSDRKDMKQAVMNIIKGGSSNTRTGNFTFSFHCHFKSYHYTL